MITVDGGRGLLYQGELEIRLERPEQIIERVRGWQAALAS